MDTWNEDNKGTCHKNEILSYVLYCSHLSTHLLHWGLFLWLPEAEPLFPGLGRVLRARGRKHCRLRLSSGVGGALRAASLHAVVSVHAASGGWSQHV